jgi:predicted nucleotidyltransferase
MLRIIRPDGDVTINLAERPGLAFSYGEYDQEMSPSLNMPADKARTLSLLTDDLRVVPNVIAIVLGGSYASGMAGASSDLDIGLYYRESLPFSTHKVRSVAERYSINGIVPVVTGLYEWGTWVNGGAWIQTPSGKVDFLYRNLRQVETVVDEGQKGTWQHDYDQQPPYGFRSVVYFGEIKMCIPLHDPEHEIARLKQRVAEYPEALKNRVVQDCLWGAEFSLLVCRGFVDAADIYNAVGCMTRAGQYMIHALFALNKRYFVSDKSANRLIDNFSLRPSDFTSRLAEVLASPGNNSAGLKTSAELLNVLWSEIVELTDGTYNPRWGSAREKLA